MKDDGEMRCGWRMGERKKSLEGREVNDKVGDSSQFSSSQPKKPSVISE